MKLVIEPAYEPGHVSMYYGQGLVTLAELLPEGPPEEGDYLAEIVVNGDWRFTFISPEHSIDFWKSDQITPKVESLIYHSFDADKVEYNGNFYEIQWTNNNWFEIFVYQYSNGEWYNLDEGILVDFDLGPTTAEIQTILEEAIDTAKENDV